MVHYMLFSNLFLCFRLYLLSEKNPGKVLIIKFSEESIKMIVSSHKIQVILSIYFQHIMVITDHKMITEVEKLTIFLKS